MELYLDLMTNRTGYLIKHTLQVLDTTGDRSLTGRRGEDHRLGLCYAMLLGELTIYSLLLLQDGGCQKRSLDRISYPPLILAFCSSVHRYGPLHIYPCICSLAPCLRVLWMSTHGCFLPLFPLSILPGCLKDDSTWISASRSS